MLRYDFNNLIAYFREDEDPKPPVDEDPPPEN